MSLRGLLVRVAVLLALGLVAGLAVGGGMSLPAAGVLAVALVGAVAAAWWARSAATAVPPPEADPLPGSGRPAAPPTRPSAHPSARRGPHPSGAGAAAPASRAEPVPPAVCGMSLEELSREWGRTALALAAAPDAAVRARVVRRRGELLDELERRDPAAFARWLAEGASAAVYPTRRLRGDSATGPGTG